MKQDISQIAFLIASDFETPVGPIPLERLMRMHEPAIGALRAVGLTWVQIARLLAQAGVCRSDGRPFSPAHLRGIYGRVVRHRRPLASGATTVVSGPSDTVVSQEPASPQVHAPIYAERSTEVPLSNDKVRSSTRGNDITAPRPKSQAAGEDSSRARVLDLMRQSALARRSRR